MTLCKMLGFLMLLIAASKSQIHFNEEKAPCDITYSDLHCIHINKCPEALSGIRRGIFPKPCGFEGKMPLVCCNELTKPGKRSIRQCDHTYEKVKIDGEGTIKYTALVLPKQTLSEQYPHMVRSQ
ncbi:PREDICTED: uncharacterized protein LOC108562822 [Nicrophorus vespilloides]|uniref:Uncharacterized protein LOC108562822 n=1 Tax=Nicrophorus vespilloides TaxID=110193 RepID=A0ABM1MQC2_NICVS|nr:PREDICTED: uncharacterized protein LOC108562822 [Nicrophorus vespilloides]